VSVTPLRRRPVNYQACGDLYWTHEPPPYCCDTCAEAALDAEMAELESRARAAGFSSLEDYAAALAQEPSA